MVNEELHASSDFSYSLIDASLHRGHDLITTYRQKMDFPTWSVVKKADASLQAISPDLLGSYPVSALDAYWQKVVEPTTKVFSDPQQSVEDKIILSTMLRMRIPHNKFCNDRVGHYTAGRILTTAQSGEQLGYSALDLLRAVEPFERFWSQGKNDASTKHLLISLILLKMKPLGDQTEVTLPTIAHYLYEKIDRYKNIAWIFLPHVSYTVALSHLATHETGRKLLGKNSSLVHFYSQPDANEAKFTYLIEQATQMRESNLHQNTLKRYTTGQKK